MSWRASGERHEFATVAKVVGDGRALTFAVDLVAPVKAKFTLQPLIGGFGDQDASRLSLRFQPAGGVDGVTPKIIRESFAADHARDDRARADPDTDVKGGVVLVVKPGDLL